MAGVKLLCHTTGAAPNRAVNFDINCAVNAISGIISNTDFPAEYARENAGFTQKLLGALRRHENKAPVLASSSVQAALDNPYGQSKKMAEDLLFAHAKETGAPVYVYALCLAALDTESVTEQLNACLAAGIPVIGFDSGVPNAPAGSIKATASTDNEAAGGVAADQMMGIETIAAAVAAATPANPVVLSVISQDATSASITGRTTGFVNQMFALADAVQPGLVAVTGHDTWNKASGSGDVAVEILVSIAATTSVTDCQAAAQAVIQRAPVGVFCTNSGSVDGMLAATSDGSDLDKANGRYKDMTVIGFDSGATLLNAVRNQWFHGAVTQDPYMIGYYAVELAYKALQGETLPEIVDTGCQYYTSENMDVPEIAALLYE